MSRVEFQDAQNEVKSGFEKVRKDLKEESEKILETLRRHQENMKRLDEFCHEQMKRLSTIFMESQNETEDGRSIADLRHEIKLLRRLQETEEDFNYLNNASYEYSLEEKDKIRLDKLSDERAELKRKLGIRY